MMQYSFFVSRRLLPLAFAGKVRPAACHTRAQAVKKLNAWFACRAGRQAACSAATTMVGPLGEALSPCACPVRQRSCMLFGDTVCRVVRQVAEEIVPEDVPDAAEQLSVDALARKDFVGMCEGAADLRGKPGDASPLAEDDVVNAVDDVHGVCVFPFRPSQTVQVMRGKTGIRKAWDSYFVTTFVRPSHCLSSQSWQRRKPTPICMCAPPAVGRQGEIHTTHGMSSLRRLSG